LRWRKCANRVTAARTLRAAARTCSPARGVTPARIRAAYRRSNANYDENNVYVYSNQPYTTATAMADGYSHSWATNGSGYALIYLNGPPPGALITVRVGRSTCTASD
jgi:hypothetical protein